MFAYLLDLDDDLAEEFDLRMRIAARQGTTVRVLEADPGPCDLSIAFEAAAGGFGLLVLDGLIVLETRIEDRTAAELLGAGDLIQLPAHRIDEMVQRVDSWRALWPVRLALLDRDFAERARPWPQLARALLRRASRRTVEVDAIRAIACHPRLEVRLDLLFWQLAGRWGRVQPDGIRLVLPLTHKLLGQLVAAERPSISHALARLGMAGLITGPTCDLHLHGTLESHLEALAEPTAVRLPRHAGVGNR
jgi:CRP-like cAMP-binding protein